MTSESATNALDGLNGVVAVLITPYDDAGGVDEKALRRLTGRVEAAGVGAITALGNTAEVHQLTTAERESVLRAVATERRQATLIAGLAGSRGSVLADAERAADLGYDAVMLHEPAEPFGDGGGVAEYFRQVCRDVALPVVLYLRTSRIPKAALAELASGPEVVAVKYARPDLDTLAELLDEGAAGQCVWINGSAESKIPAFAAVGVTAFTSGIANVRPDLAVAVHRAVTEDRSRLDQLLDLVRPVEALRSEGHGRFNVAVLKELLTGLGYDPGGVRPPHSPLTAEATERLAAAVAKWPPEGLTP